MKIIYSNIDGFISIFIGKECYNVNFTTQTKSENYFHFIPPKIIVGGGIMAIDFVRDIFLFDYFKHMKHLYLF